jgi:hypothetical protein
MQGQRGGNMEFIPIVQSLVIAGFDPAIYLAKIASVCC